MKKAEWHIDYDMHTDKCFERPQCPECIAPIYEYEEDEFKCISCGEIMELDNDMIKWVRERAGTKIEMDDCFNCNGTKCVETHYVKNDVTLKWQTAWGVCKNCGRRFIV